MREVHPKKKAPRASRRLGAFRRGKKPVVKYAPSINDFIFLGRL
jgi:hypothetical protein